MTATNPDEKPGQPKAGQTAPGARAIRVALVDDSKYTRDRAAALLNALDGIEVVGEAADVQQGLELVKQTQPDVIVLDIDLPGGSGIDMLRDIKRNAETPIVIMLTSYDHPKLRERCGELGANYYFHKLTEFEKMAAVCEELVAQALIEGQAGDSANKSENRYRHIFKETGQVVYDYELATGIIRWDGAAEEVLGYTWQEMERSSIQDWENDIHPDDRAEVIASLGEAIARADRYHVEYRFRRKDGAYIFVEEHGSFQLDSRGNPARMLGTLIDITRRKNTEERLREQARLLDLAQDAIIVRDLEDKILYWNASAQRVYGWSVDEVIGLNAGELLHEDSAASVEISRAVLEKNEWHGELTHVTKSGLAILVEGRLTLVRDRQGQPKSILAINADITERKKLEAQFLRAQRMDSIGTLASGVAHDLNNVLTPIMTACQLLPECKDESDKRQMLDLIASSVQRGANLVKQVLSFCRGAEGRRIEMRPKSIIMEVDHIIRETFPKSMRFEIKIAPDLWAVIADPTQLHQVLLNLCVNARDAMPNGGLLKLTAENQLLDAEYTSEPRADKGRPHVVITVEDSGTGIAPELQEKVFDPFFTTKEVGKGTGLGLSTSLAIVKNHGGFINLSSEPGKGASFKVFLPALSESHGATFITREAQFPRGHGELVLVVDDESAIRTVMKQTLLTFGYRVLVASDGLEALNLFRQHASDVAVLLTDMMMPSMDGATTIQTLRKLNPQLKVIAASGLCAEANLAQGMNDAATVFLAKPYSAEMLLNTLATVLHGAPGH